MAGESERSYEPAQPPTPPSEGLGWLQEPDACKITPPYLLRE